MALTMIDAALAWTEQTGGKYDVPDLLRMKGQILLSSSNGGIEAGEQALLQSLCDQPSRRRACGRGRGEPMQPDSRPQIRRWRRNCSNKIFGLACRALQPQGAPQTLMK
jgi:hypothetical protein